MASDDWGIPSDPQDVRALADMLGQFFAPTDGIDDIPRARLEGLARDLIAHNGDDGHDTYAAIEAWIGDYL